MTESTQFQLKPWRRPIPYLTLLIIAGIAWFAGMGICLLKLGFGREASIVAGGLAAAAIVAWILWKDNRTMPAGVLRLAPGRLEFTARLQGAIEAAPSEIRDMVESMGTLVVRRRNGPPILVHPARLDVPIASVAAAINSWMTSAEGVAGAAFFAETAKTQ